MRAPAAVLPVLICLIVACGSDHGSESVEGIWQGVLKYPGFESRIAFVITGRPDGTLVAAMAKPDETDARLPVTQVTFENGRLRLQVDSIGGCFDGRVNVRKGTVEGQWDHGRWSQALVLRRVSQIVAPRRPQTPVRPYPYDEQEVVFVNRRAGARLAGTLTLPSTAESCPAAILISGVGAHDRDYSILCHRPFLVLADSLTRRGVAVLRFDDRGFGQSTGDRSQATSADYAGDVLAGFRCLQEHARIDPNRIGLIGHSEGGTIAMLAAAECSDVAFIVLMGTPGLPGREYNLQFEESTARAMGLPEAAIAAKREFQDRILSVVMAESARTEAEKELRRLYTESYPSMPGDKIEAAIRRLLSPWFCFSVAHDPAGTLQRVGCPVLAVFGGKDVQVPHEGNLDAIQGALERAGNPEFHVECLPEINHFLQTAPTGSPTEYGRIEETIAPHALQVVGDWVLRHGR